MSIPQILQHWVGTWVGKKRLWLSPDKAVRESDAMVTVNQVAMARFINIDYTWSFDGQAQAGSLLLGQESEQATISAVWVDSWHMGDAMMHCRGNVEEDGLKIVGSYGFGDGPAWGWRITIHPDDTNRLKLVMYNVSPEGPEDLAVEINCTRRL